MRRGGIVLIAGDAGVGKTRLAEHLLEGGDVQVLRGAADERATAPYGPIAAALGEVPTGADRATVCEAARRALRALARRTPVVMFLDDLQWADATTIELLPALVAVLADDPVLVLGAYRTDELTRDHPLRRMRAELRRAGRLQELALGPLDRDETTELAAQVLGAS